MKRLDGRVAVVTGAAGGIGRATSIALAREGCDLAISDVNMNGLEETADAIRALGRRVCTHEVDVADKQRMLQYVDEVMEEFGGVNILVNNAGVTVTAHFEDHTIEEFEWLFGINVWGVVYGCKFFLPHLLAADEAHIVNISSVFGIVGVPAQSSYCASKFAVRGFTESLCAELAAKGVGVTSVHPGSISTNIAKSARGADQEAKDIGVKLVGKGVPPAHAADRIVGAIKRKKLRVLIAKEAHAGDWLKRVAPTAVQKIIAAGFGRMRK
jgi:NAD(P)-dependent dehydrogenase (short-subunit alcohol dehydrogenase family)